MPINSEALRERRKALGLSYRELASMAKCSQTAIFAMESGGTKSPNIDLLVRVAKALGCSVSDLMILAPDSGGGHHGQKE